MKRNLALNVALITLVSATALQIVVLKYLSIRTFLFLRDIGLDARICFPLPTHRPEGRATFSGSLITTAVAPSSEL